MPCVPWTDSPASLAEGGPALGSDVAPMASHQERDAIRGRARDGRLFAHRPSGSRRPPIGHNASEAIASHFVIDNAQDDSALPLEKFMIQSSCPHMVGHTLEISMTGYSNDQASKFTACYQHLQKARSDEDYLAIHREQILAANADGIGDADLIQALKTAYPGMQVTRRTLKKLRQRWRSENNRPVDQQLDA